MLLIEGAGIEFLEIMCSLTSLSLFPLLFFLTFGGILADSLAFLDSFMTRCLGHFPREPMQILLRNGSWSLLASIISGC